MKVTGVPVRGDRARAAAGSRASARALAEATDERGARAGARRSRARCSQHGTTTFEGKTGYGLSREGELRAAAARPRAGCARRPADAVTGLFAHAVPPGYDADGWMDEVDGARARERDVDALDIYVESVAFGNEHLERLGEIARATGVPLRAHVEQFDAPLGAGRAGARARARSTTSPACTPTTSRRWPRPSAPPCCCPAPSSWAPSRRRRRARWPTRARSACWPPTATRAPRRSPRCR